MSETGLVIAGGHILAPGTGQLIDLHDEVECAQALDALRQFENQIREAKAALTEAIVERSRVLGSKTIPLPNGFKAVVKGGSETVYDAVAIEDGLRALGMPENRLRDIVVEQVTYRVKAVEAKRAASVNEEYAALIERNRQIIQKAHSVSIER